MQKILISHRGNINGINKEKENTEPYILEAIELGFKVEVDVWLINKSLYLGHDRAEHSTNLSFLQNRNLWCHAKNVKALEFMLENHIHCFYHQSDDCVLTSRGFIWTYPGKELTHKSIAVLPENQCFDNLNTAAGVCSDFVESYRDLAS